MRKRAKTDHLWQRAKQYFAGGVNSPVRSFKNVGGQPLLLERGKGPFAYDNDDNQYIDYVLSYGALILGHAYPSITNAAKQVLRNGGAFGTTHRLEIECAERIQKAIPLIECMRFVNSGTEAVMGAIRVARGYTGRDIIVKFENAYHGHADYLLAKGGSGLATLNIPNSAGVPKEFVKYTHVLPANDAEAIKSFFKWHGKHVAAVIVEPVGGNYGVIEPDIFFLRQLRKLTEQSKALLIFDEVITGFRFHCGSVADILRVTPDLMCLGKIVGGGFPIGVYGGSKKIMDSLAPVGKVYQASTFAGHPVVMAAAGITIDELAARRSTYGKLIEKSRILAEGIKQHAIECGILVHVSSWGPMFSLRFENKDHFTLFYKELLDMGIYFAPSEYESNFVSFSHTNKHIETTLSGIKNAFQTIKKG